LAANLALAALPGFTSPGDTSASARYFKQDITTPFVMENGYLIVPNTAGIGVEPDM
jgi:O-succinylbenzoate synthase